MQPGGQLTITTDVENYPGFADVIQGPWLMDQMIKQAEHVGTRIITDYIHKIDFSKRPFVVSGSSGAYTADAIVIATGAQAKWLGLESESAFQGFGVSGCATCDGFFYRGKEVIVVGGGNTAVEEALYLTNHASKVTLVHRRDSLRAEKILQDRLFKHPKIEVLWNHTLVEVKGTDNPKSVTSAVLQNTLDKTSFEKKIDGIFIAIGHKPNTDLFKGVLDMDEEGYLITKPNSTKTNIDGIFAAGDVQDKIFRQAVTAAGTGCMAALEADKFLA
ncbi:MAG UNVERIFIED_CONTAM: thioredoxin-disulfide reductase [Planctomycetaceae bacterium]|jgi:thioredoxin reductase (NADPH)